MDHTKRLGTAPLLPLIISFSLPSIISMLMNALYNIFDRIFIGQFAGENALGGLTISFPVMMVMFAIGGLFGMGGAALISIKFGEHDLDGANKIFGNLAVLTVASSLVMMTLGQIFLPQLLTLVGATPASLPHAQEYMRIILLGLVFQLSSFTLAALVRTEGKPYFAMASQLVAAGVNIVLDYLFIGVFGMGVQGAAIATVIGQFAGFAMLAWHFFISKKSMLKLTAANLKLKLSIALNIFVIGGSTLVINIGTSVSAAIMNIALITYGGDSAIAAMGAIGSMIVVVMMPIFGLQQGIGPIIGYNHGNKQPDRVKKAFWTGLWMSSAFAFAMFAVLAIIPHTIAELFFAPGSPTIEVFVQGLLLHASFLLLLPFTVMITAYFQSTAQGRKGLTLSISRQVIIIITVLVFPIFWDLPGVWLTGPAGEIFTVLLGFILLATRQQGSAQTLLSRRRPAEKSMLP